MKHVLSGQFTGPHLPVWYPETFEVTLTSEHTLCVQCKCVRERRVTQSQSSPSKTTPSFLSGHVQAWPHLPKAPHQKQAASDLPAIASPSVPSSQCHRLWVPSCYGSYPCPSPNTYMAVTGRDFRRAGSISPSPSEREGQYFPPRPPGRENGTIRSQEV